MAHQVRLNLLPGARISFIFEPPGYQLHLWEAESGLVTHTAVFDDWSGPPPVPAPHPLPLPAGGEREGPARSVGG